MERWTATSTLTPKVRGTFRTILLKVGRWLAKEHPEICEPAQWTRELCAEYLALVDRLCIGDYAQRWAPFANRIGRPLSAKSKAGYITAVRIFFHDCQEWEWIARRFDPSRALATPRSIRALTGPDPRVIADAVWAKLVWAGLNLEASDLPANTGGQFYPLELVRALAITWLFAGLRSDELSRLRLGCIRWQREEVEVMGQPTEQAPKEAVCLLDIPTHKTGTAFTKPVDPLVGQAIAAWEAVRPAQPPMLDRRTGEHVQFLFCYRATRVAKEYLNVGLIPALGRKAGVPLEDVRGRITSHRARATIASQLYNAKPCHCSNSRNGLGIAPLPRRNITRRLLQPSWQNPTLMPGTSDATRVSSRSCSIRMRSRVGWQWEVHRGSFTTWGTATAPTISLISVRIGWPAPSAHFTVQRDRAKRNCWKARPICRGCCKRYPSPKTNALRSKTGSRPWRNCASSSQMFPLLPG